MIYIVTGDGPKCGSSMMMRALEAGGIENAYNEASNLEGTPSDDIRELSLEEMCQPGFPDPAIYADKVIKVFPPPWMPLTALARHEYKVVWLRRDFEDRWASFKRQYGVENTPSYFGGATRIVFNLRWLAAQTAHPFMQTLPYIDMITMTYDQVIKYPLRSFQFMAEHGWPIDPDKAAKVPKKGPVAKATA